MFAIVVALKKEADSFINQLDSVKKIALIDKEAYACQLKGKDFILAISGIGKVNAALTTQILIDRFSPDFIINFGTAGGLNDSVKAKNYYLAKGCCQYDFDLSELDGVSIGYIQDYDCVYFNTSTEKIDFLPLCLVASGDRFNNGLDDVNTILSLDGNVKDMECGAIAQVCTANKIPLYVIKGITDVVGSGLPTEQFMQNLREVSSNFVKVINKVILNLA